MTYMLFRCLVFYKEEDGIQDKLVTGVQTCALPIYQGGDRTHIHGRRVMAVGGARRHPQDRKSVVEGKRVDLGGRRIIKKKRIAATVAPNARAQQKRTVAERAHVVIL